MFELEDVDNKSVADATALVSISSPAASNVSRGSGATSTTGSVVAGDRLRTGRLLTDADAKAVVDAKSNGVLLN